MSIFVYDYPGLWKGLFLRHYGHPVVKRGEVAPNIDLRKDEYKARRLNANV